MILILGGGRSGTTFLAKLFDSHPNVLYRHEPDSIAVNSEIPFLPELSAIERYRSEARDYLSRLQDLRAPKVALHLPVFRKDYRSGTRQGVHYALAVLGKAVSRLPWPGLERSIVVPDLISNGRVPVPVIKSVNSICRARLFAEACPGVKVIHLVRHPCAVVASKLRGRRQGLMKGDSYIRSLFGVSDARHFSFSLEDMLARSAEEQLAFQWLVQNEKVFHEMEGCTNYRMARYEDLCKDPLALMKALFTFAGLDWSQQTERFIAALRAGRWNNTSYFSVLRIPDEGLERWRAELMDEAIANIKLVASRGSLGKDYIY